METKDQEFKPFNVDVWKHDGHAGALIPLLQSAQDTYGYVSERAMDYISHVTGIPPAEIYGVVTFYAQFRTKPLGEKIIKVCNGTACHVNGVKEIANTLKDELGIDYEETTEDGKVSMVSVACLGCCSLAPVVMVSNETFGRLTPQKTRKLVRDLRRK
ncbi:MAG: NADH-quinone oxidoreductase subunit NuoE [Candidatus Zixiibacteriota bacterium]